jgi:hypothetical protein
MTILSTGYPQVIPSFDTLGGIYPQVRNPHHATVCMTDFVVMVCTSMSYFCPQVIHRFQGYPQAEIVKGQNGQKWSIKKFDLWIKTDISGHILLYRNKS